MLHRCNVTPLQCYTVTILHRYGIWFSLYVRMAYDLSQEFDDLIKRQTESANNQERINKVNYSPTVTLTNLSGVT